MSFNTEPFETTIVVKNIAQLTSVYALLSGTMMLVPASDAFDEHGHLTANRRSAGKPIAASPATEKPSATEEMPASESPASDGSGATATNTASPSEAVEVDAAGTPFDPARHTGTKVKSGLWRMKAGLSRGPGEGEDAIPGNGTGTNESGPEPDAGNSATAPAADEEDDEFAAFTKANSEAEGAAAVPERTWTDADLSSLCAQAATKLGNADPVRAIIANYVPEGETPHSRNVPASDRAAFAAEVEKAAGITYAG